jgi:hypothetical protein
VVPDNVFERRDCILEFAIALLVTLGGVIIVRSNKQCKELSRISLSLSVETNHVSGQSQIHFGLEVGLVEARKTSRVYSERK